MLKEVEGVIFCSACGYFIRTINTLPSLSLNGKDYYKIECSHPTCNNKNAFSPFVFKEKGKLQKDSFFKKLFRRRK